MAASILPLAGALLALGAAAQDAGEGRPLTVGAAHTLASEVLGEPRDLWVATPPDYRPEQAGRYALLVLADGPWDFRLAAGLVRSLSGVGVMPPLVVVGVPNPRRERDLIPFQDAGFPESGGGDRYLEFLAREALPWIDERWPTSGYRVYSGHSLGGLTALNVVLREPELFDAVLALSPSLEVGEGRLLEELAVALDARERLDLDLYVAVGDEPLEGRWSALLAQELEARAPDGLRWTREVFEARDEHNSMRVTGLLAGLRWVWRDWRLGSPRVFELGLEGCDAHYARASERYGQPRELSPYQVTLAAWWGLRQPGGQARALELARAAVECWPELAECHAVLSDALAAAGELDLALEAIDMAIERLSGPSDGHLALYEATRTRLLEALED